MKRCIIAVIAVLALMFAPPHETPKESNIEIAYPSVTAPTAVTKVVPLEEKVASSAEKVEPSKPVMLTGATLTRIEPDATEDVPADDFTDFMPEAEEISTEEPEPVYEAVDASDGTSGNGTYLGEYRITFNCPAECCCGSWAYGPTASGVYPTSGWTVACGEDIPFGTLLEIDGQTYCCEDRGVPSGCIDIYVDDHDEALARGMYYTSVYMK